MPHLKPSSNVTKHSDYFVGKDTPGRVARRCADTIDKKQVNSCVLKDLFGGSGATKNVAKTPRKCSLQRTTNVTFSKFRG